MARAYTLRQVVRLAGLALTVPLALGLAAGISAAAQESEAKKPAIGNTPLIGKLETCTAITDDAQRLACFDREVAALVGATNQGDVRVVETEDITDARKKLFGFSVPNSGIFAVDEEDEEAASTLVSKITRVRQVGPKEYHFWIEEGDAMWRMKGTTVRFRAPEVGDEVEFKPATMGTYWIRVNGRNGVRGNRIG